MYQEFETEAQMEIEIWGPSLSMLYCGHRWGEASQGEDVEREEKREGRIQVGSPAFLQSSSAIKHNDQVTHVMMKIKQACSYAAHR